MTANDTLLMDKLDGAVDENKLVGYVHSETFFSSCITYATLTFPVTNCNK